MVKTNKKCEEKYSQENDKRAETEKIDIEKDTQEVTKDCETCKFCLHKQNFVEKEKSRKHVK